MGAEMIVTVGAHPPLTAGRCRVIAEAGANHNNSVERAIQMAVQAAKAGAWAIKFQLYKAERLSAPAAPKYWRDEIGTRTQFEAFKLSDHLSYGDYADVAAACDDLGILFFATPFDFDAVDALEAMDVPLYKIASGDLTNRPLMRYVGQTGKPTVVSTGAATADEVDRALEWLGLPAEKVVLLTCTLTYPTPDEDGNFLRIETFRRRFAPHLIGFSDHTLGVAGGWVAAALGASVIEKHYTIDKALPDIPDHKISLGPEELAELVEACDRGAVMRGSSEIRVAQSEIAARANARRSVATSESVQAGEVFRLERLTLLRPGIGIEPARLEEVALARASRDVSAGEILTEEMIQS